MNIITMIQCLIARSVTLITKFISLYDCQDICIELMIYVWNNVISFYQLLLLVLYLLYYLFDAVLDKTFSKDEALFILQLIICVLLCNLLLLLCITINILL